MMNKVKVPSKTIKEFIRASFENDFEAFNDLLSSKGEFNIQDQDEEILEVNKNEFIDWYKNKLIHFSIQSVEFDHCSKCVKGGNVVMFNKGLFPVQNKKPWNMHLTGLLIEEEEGQIINIAFCYAFENKRNIACSKANYS